MGFDPSHPFNPGGASIGLNEDVFAPFAAVFHPSAGHAARYSWDGPTAHVETVVGASLFEDAVPSSSLPSSSSSSSLFALPHPAMPRVASFDLLGGCAAVGPSDAEGAGSNPVRDGSVSSTMAADGCPRWHALEPGTDLNKPPPESIHAGGSIAPWQPYRLFPTHQPPRGRPAPPDFVSTAENLKALLQLPWTNQPISLAVHRCGSTLLLDDVNVNPGGAGQESTGASGGPGMGPRMNVGGGKGERGERHRRFPPGFPIPGAHSAAAAAAERAPRGDGGCGHVEVMTASPPPHASYAAAAAAAAETEAVSRDPVLSLTGGPGGGPSPLPGETGERIGDAGSGVSAHAMLEAKLLYHSLSVEAGLMQLEHDADHGAGAKEGGGERLAMLPSPAGATQHSPPLALAAPVPVANTGGAMVLWGTAASRGSQPAGSPPPSPTSRASDRTSDEPGVGRGGGEESDWLALPPSTRTSSAGPAGALQLRGPAHAVARAAAAESMAAGLVLAPNPYAAVSNHDIEVCSAGQTAREAAAASSPSKVGGSGGGLGGGGGSRPGREGGGKDEKEGCLPPDFGQPHLFEWEVHGLRLLVESSLVVFQREHQTPVSLKLVDLNAERPNTGTALSTWLDNTIAGVPELAVCYHKGGLIHHYDVLQTDDIARLCAPPFNPETILTYAARVLRFLQHHCKEDGSQYWLLGDGSVEGGLHLYDVTKGVMAATTSGDTSASDAGGSDAGSEFSEDSDAAERARFGGRKPTEGGKKTRVGPRRARREEDTLALPAPPLVLPLPWIDTHNGADGRSAGGRSRSESGSATPVSRVSGPAPPSASVASAARVAGALGRYALLERVAAVLSAVDHPAMFASYKEELAAACLSGGADLGGETDAGAGVDEQKSKGPPSGGCLSPALTFGDLAPGVSLGAARKALEHLAEAEGALAAALFGAAEEKEKETKTRGRDREGEGEDDGVPGETVGRVDAGPGGADVDDCGGGGNDLEAQLRRVVSTRASCHLAVARRLYRDGCLGAALASAEAAMADAVTSASTSAAAAATLGDIHAALREAASTDQGAAATEAAVREWNVARDASDGHRDGAMIPARARAVDAPSRSDDSAERTTRGACGVDDEDTPGEETDDAEGFLGHGPVQRHVGLGPGDAARHMAAAESCYAAAAEGSAVLNDPAGLSNVWRRYGAIRNERGKMGLREAAGLAASAPSNPATMRTNAIFVLDCAEACYSDAARAFESARDPINAALVGLNRAQACRARVAWNLPRRSAGGSSDGKGSDGSLPDGRDWRLVEFETAATHCRGALASLSRRPSHAPSPPQGVAIAVRVELGNALLAEGLLRAELAGGAVAGDASLAVAVARMEEAIRVLQTTCGGVNGVGRGGGPAAASLATAHFHLGCLLAEAVLSEEKYRSDGGEDSNSGGSPGAGASVGRSVGRLAAPQRHLERALLGFPAAVAPLDHARLRLQLARVTDAAARAAVRAGGGAVAGVGHWEAAVAHLLGASEAFGQAPAAVRWVSAGRSDPHDPSERPAPPREATAEAEAAAAGAWGDVRREVEVLLLAVLKSLVQSSKGSKRHAAHRELYSGALRWLKEDEGDFARCLRELMETARAAHVVR